MINPALIKTIYLFRIGFLALVMTVLSACSVGGRGPSGATYELNIAHVNDTHSNIRSPDTQELLVDGQKVYSPLGGFSQLITLFKSLEGTNSLGDSRYKGPIARSAPR